MKPKKQQVINFINDCNCLVNYDLLEQAILWYSKDFVFAQKHIFMYGKYPAVSIYNKKIHVHRLLKSYIEKRILERNEYVHHIDGNKLNASISNLEIIKQDEHQSMHNKGRKFSVEHKTKISKANMKRKGIKLKKRIDMPYLDEYVRLGYSINKIAKIYNCDWSTVKNRIYENPEFFEP